MSNEDLTMVAMEIIASSGNARSCFVDAIDKAIEGNIEEANKSIEEGRNVFLDGRKAHAKLIADCADGFVKPDLLLVHAQDQMASAETIEIIASKIIAMYQNKK